MTTLYIKTPLPQDIAENGLIATMHDHAMMIKAMCPELIEYNKVEEKESGQVVYEVTDKKPVGKTTYKLTLTNVPDGVDSQVVAKPPTGTLTITGHWRVDGAHLTEEVHIDSNFVLKKMAKNNVEKTHPGQHALLVEEARSRTAKVF